MLRSTPIKVGIKIKPSAQKKAYTRVELNGKSGPALFVAEDGEEKKYCVNAIHDANTSDATTFTDLQIDSFVEKFISGYNVTVMAYGQTGAGKTYAMEGSARQPGIIQESIRMVFRLADESSNLRCSYMQLYNEKIYDLLGNEAMEENLKLRWESEKDFVVENLSFEIAYCAADMEKTWRRGTKNRVVASNKIHQMSSRSHAIFTITLDDYDEHENYRTRQMTFVDLAGSERITQKMDKLTRQSIEINKSLFVLRKVIKCLEETALYNRYVHIPYRDSKLTCLLKKAFGGNCLTMMIACIDGNANQREQTLLTLSYAISAGQIKNVAKVNIDEQALENRYLKAENEKLKKQLETAMRQVQILSKKQKMETQKKYTTQYSHKIIQCIGTIRELIKSNKELREELDDERQMQKQQKMEINMLIQQNQSLKKSHNYSSIPELPHKFSPILPQKIRVRQVIGANNYRSKNSILKRKKYTLHNKTEESQSYHNRSSSQS